MSRRLALAAVVVCLAGAGVASQRGDAGPSSAPLVLTGKWQRIGSDAFTRVWVGASNDDPQRGVAIVAHGVGRWHPPMAVLQTASRDGALTIVAPPGTTDAFTLRAGDGHLYDLELRASGSSLLELGGRIDARHLPALPRRGIAVDVRYGPAQRHAVVLAAVAPSFRIVGFLDGWRVAGIATDDEQLSLAAPPVLLDPQGAAHLLSAAGLKLEPHAPHGRGFTPRSSANAACHGAHGVLRCAGLPVLSYRNPTLLPDVHLVRAEPSPDRRTYLVQGVAGCDDADHLAFFLDAEGGLLAPVAAGGDIAGTTALGWLSSGEALVSVESTADCGSAASGIYRVRPGGQPQLVLPTLSRALVAWGV